MMPSGAVIPDPTYQLTIPLSNMLRPVAMFALLFIGAALAAILAWVATELRKRPVPTGLAADKGAPGTADTCPARAPRHAA
ncbi:MAG: hypothetical protein DMD33_18950 [Gemmatimonadetes bacterium]|nr:MAG: hypothetical protein DMD33_18950 [Gemmatimonadota bacterium]